MNLLILIPREFGKTTLITRAGMLWLHLQDPELSVYIGSENKEQAIKFFKPLKEILNGADPYQKFSHFYGNWYNKDREWKEERVVHAVRKATAVPDPSFGIWGVETGLTGSHPDVLCFDDPVSYEKMSTHGNWLQIVNDHVSSLNFVLKGDGLRVWIGTRYHDGDHIGTTLRKHGAKTVAGMPCPDIDPRENGIWNLYFLAARDLKGRPIYSQFNEARLTEIRQENEMKYYAQMMNDPSTGEHVPLTRKQVDQLWVNKKDVPKNLRISVHIDTAFKYRDRIARGDENVIQVWGHARDGSGDLYFLEGYSSRTWRAEDFNAKLVAILQRLRASARWPFVLTDELEMGGKAGTWELTLQSWCHAVNMPAPRILLIPRGNKKKLLRMTEAASYWIEGHVKLVETAPGVETLVDQMIKIGTSAYDDWSDTASDVFHKDVYMPMRLRAKDQQVDIVRPYDAELKDGTLPTGNIVRQKLDEIRIRSNQGGYVVIE